MAFTSPFEEKTDEATNTARNKPGPTPAPPGARPVASLEQGQALYLHQDQCNVEQNQKNLC